MGYARWIIIGVVGVIAFVGILWYIAYSNSYSQSEATSKKVLLSLSPSSGLFDKSNVYIITALIHTDDPAKKISSFTLAVKPEGSVQIVSIGKPSTFPDGITNIFVQVTSNTFEVMYDIPYPQSQQPSVIKVPITMRGTGPKGNVSVELLQAAGNVAGNTYDISEANQTGIYTFKTF